jgi:hypothetical protein
MMKRATALLLLKNSSTTTEFAMCAGDGQVAEMIIC